MRTIERFLTNVEEYIINYKRTIVWFGVVIIIIMALFPPWVLEGFREGGASFKINQGYSFILSPPNNGVMVHIDIGRFCMQCVPIVAIIILVLFLIKNQFSVDKAMDYANNSKEFNKESKYKGKDNHTDQKVVQKVTANDKKCPQCDLINPPFSLKCSCGYKFK